MARPKTTQNTENGQSDSTVKRDWARLIDDAELMLDGIENRIGKAEREIRRLLGGHQNAEPIMQLLGIEPGRQPHETYAAFVAKRLAIAAKLDTYRRGQANEAAKLVSEVPVNPDDRSKDVEAEPATENGKVAVTA